MACLAIIGLFLLVAAPTMGTDFWNIDCGGNSSSTSGNGLPFEGDGQYIRSGESRKIRPVADSNISAELSTLRAFPTRWRKNCYRIPVEQGTKVLVRTRHCYGNYDGLDSPPEFVVRFDTSEWCTWRRSLDPNCQRYCEVVYVTTKKQGMDICLIRTQEGETPFVSTIEVQKLHKDMYSLLEFSSFALFLKSRFAFGAKVTINDGYNRNWKPYSLEGNEGIVPAFIQRQNRTFVDTDTYTSDFPPPQLFQSAAVPPTVDNKTAANITVPMPWLISSDPVPIYFTMYFTVPVPGNSQMAIDLYKDGELFSNASNPIRPKYGFASQYSASGYKASNESAFDLVPSKGSTLPPAISGMEVFFINAISNATDSSDVEALSTLQSNFTVLHDWTGDPCQPEGYTWEWVGCSYPDKSPPRINKLLLSGYQLSDTIPDFSSLDALEYIDLSNNNFSGKVPDFIGSLPKLQTLDLSFNGFDSIPSSLRENPNITLITRGNPKIEALVQAPPGPSTQVSGSIKVGIPMLAACFFILATVAML